MDFNQVVVFVKVVQAGSFSAAARLLGIARTTLYHRMDAPDADAGRDD